MRLKKLLLTLLITSIILDSCGPKRKTDETQVPLRVVQVPTFNADSAYFFVEKQVRFGPRVPNTKAHHQAAQYFIDQFKKNGATVLEQDFDAITWDNQKVQLKNIIASYNPEAKKRILLAAHWDTSARMQTKTLKKKDAPFDGANDGASGVGVLLEISRLLGQGKMPSVGIDLILFDGEDWGEKENEKSKLKDFPEGYEVWWCIGSQYWAKHKHVKNYTAYYGIVLDMVGAKHASIPSRRSLPLNLLPRLLKKFGTLLLD